MARGATKKEGAKRGAKKEAAPRKQRAPKVMAEQSVAEVEHPRGGNGSKVNRERYSYQAHPDVKTASNRAAVDNGDAVADALRGKTLEEVVQILTDSGGTVNDKWTNLNVGMYRMAAGNALRRIWRQEGRIKVGGRWVRNPDHIAANENEETPPAATKRGGRRKAA